MNLFSCSFLFLIPPAASAGQEPASLTVAPEAVELFLFPTSTIILVTVFDGDGNPVAGTTVDFESADPQLAEFGYRQSITDSNGAAATVVSRLVMEGEFETSFTVSSGALQAGPFPILGISVSSDGSPLGFHAPPLEPFRGTRQRLSGWTGYFMPLPIGTEVRAWAIDPTIAEPGTGTITADLQPPDHGQVLEFVVTAHRLGQTVFLIETLDAASYTAIVTGDLGEPSFLRADCDGNAGIDINDPVTLLNYLFLGSADPPCLKAADADDSGRLDISDAIYPLNFLFLAGKAIPEPYPSPGPDPTPDLLDCVKWPI